MGVLSLPLQSCFLLTLSDQRGDILPFELDTVPSFWSWGWSRYHQVLPGCGPVIPQHTPVDLAGLINRYRFVLGDCAAIHGHGSGWFRLHLGVPVSHAERRRLSFFLSYFLFFLMRRYMRTLMPGHPQNRMLFSAKAFLCKVGDAYCAADGLHGHFANPYITVQHL